MTRGRGIAPAAGICRGSLLIALALLAWLPVPSAAVEMPSLYTVEVPLDPNDRNAQSKAYRAALAEVLVRVTGSTEAGQSAELAGLFPNPTQYVRQMRPAPDNKLVVSLNGPAIERVLRQSGATVWGSDRPLTIVWLAVDWGQGDREIVAADDPDRSQRDARSIDRNRMLRERVQAVATRRGLPVVFPLLDVEDLQKIGFIDIWGGFDDSLLEASARYDADSILVGRIRPEDGDQARWTWYVDGQRFAWPGEPEMAIDQLADSLAAREAIRGDEAPETLQLTISGIDSIASFGRVQSYLDGQGAIDGLRLLTAAADRVTYEVTVRGGAERLRNTLSTSRLLEPAGTGPGMPGSAYPPFGSPPAARTLEFRLVPGTVAPRPQPVTDPEPGR